MNKQKEQAQFYYLLLAGIFIALLVACNLIFQKFFVWEPFGFFRFEISVGLIPYPLTFLVTDLISEIYGKKKANQVVMVGLITTVIVMGVVMLATEVPATAWSPVNDGEFQKVFGLTGVAVSASMFAYLFAQFIDIKVFHFLKNLTKGKHLWLRNNFSTITSQFVDTNVVLLLMCSLGAIQWNLFGQLLLSGFLFKIIVALLDTPLFYLFTYLFKKKFGLNDVQEVEI
ncbi:MAG: queuosine precursor transporter [Flavobacteriales bacterium]|nr:queuosine precursor transporter [Flavobacteriales bacterium]